MRTLKSLVSSGRGEAFFRLDGLPLRLRLPFPLVRLRLLGVFDRDFGLVLGCSSTDWGTSSA